MGAGASCERWEQRDEVEGGLRRQADDDDGPHEQREGDEGVLLVGKGHEVVNEKAEKASGGQREEDGALDAEAPQHAKDKRELDNERRQPGWIDGGHPCRHEDYAFES